MNWLNDIKTYSCDQILLTIVGNKADLQEKRQVSREEAETFAHENNFQYFETSAKSGDNIEELFLSIANQVLNKIEKGEIDPKNEVT
jgi:Ras-related protein Rab-2A